MKAIRSVVALVPPALLLPFVIACSHGGATPSNTAAIPPPTTAATPQEMTANGPPSTGTPAPNAMRGAWMDPAKAMLDAAGGLQLTDTQRATVRALEDRLDMDEKNMRSAFGTLHAELAREVRAGAISPVALQSQEDGAMEALRTHIDKEVDSANGLHAALDASQRASVVAAVRASQPGSAEAQSTAGTPSSPEAMRQKKLARLTSELGLDESQQQQVSALLAAEGPLPMSMQDRQRHIDALLNAFPGTAFDARTSVPSSPMSPTDTMRAAVDREVGFLTRLLPILRPEQRELLASHMESRTMMHGADSD